MKLAARAASLVLALLFLFSSCREGTFDEPEVSAAVTEEITSSEDTLLSPPPDTEADETTSEITDEITEEMLWAELDPIISSIITDGMSLKDRAWEIYDYVYDHIHYSPTSDKSSWVRAAYEGITTGYGDCYTYFALSKAFFERAGIENIDIQRSAEVVSKVDERHFWSLVNIGTKESPAWYHFDACHIKDNPKPWGYLMTDAQLAAYSSQKESANGVRNYFYAYDRTAYPATPTQKINTDY